MIKRLVLTAVLAAASLPALAVEPDEILADPALEARAREVGKELRCVVCQNQSIDDSNAELARDMRVLVRKRIQAGDTNEEVLAYMVSRYGDFVLLDPPFKATTYVLWLGPAAIAALGLIGVISFYRRRTAGANNAPTDEAAKPLSTEEEAKLKALLNEEDKA